MNIKRVVISVFLILILSMFLQWLNKTSFFESFHAEKPQFKKINIQTGDNKNNKTTSNPPPIGVYGQGQYGEPQMAGNGYYVETGIGGGHYYGGGQPINVKYIYTDIHHFFPLWYKQAAFS